MLLLQQAFLCARHISVCLSRSYVLLVVDMYIDMHIYIYINIHASQWIWMSTILTIRIWRRPSVRPVASLNAARSHRRPCVWTCQQFVTPRVGERVLGALASKSDFWPMQGFLQNSGGHVRFDLGVRKPWMKFMVCHYLEGIKLMYSFE